MFPKKLGRLIEKHSSVIIHAQTTVSRYYHINNVIVRLSDHVGKISGYDLAVYYCNRHYIVIGKCGKRYIEKTFTTANDVIIYIKKFNEFKTLFLG